MINRIFNFILSWFKKKPVYSPHITLDQLRRYSKFDQELRIKVRPNQNHPAYENVLKQNQEQGRDYIAWTYTLAYKRFLDPYNFNMFDIQPLLRPMESFSKEIDFYGDKFIPAERTTIGDTESLLKWSFNVFGIEDYHPILT